MMLMIKYTDDFRIIEGLVREYEDVTPRLC